MSGKVSSQFLSALLMAAPFAKDTLTVKVADELISAPYVRMTVRLMEQFGVKVECHGDSEFTVRKGQRFRSPGEIAIEGDASSASYFLAGGAITGGPVTVHGCGAASIQGDVRFADVLGQMGATVTWTDDTITVSREPSKRLKGMDVDCGDIPDAAMTLAVRNVDPLAACPSA